VLGDRFDELLLGGHVVVQRRVVDPDVLGHLPQPEASKPDCATRRKAAATSSSRRDPHLHRPLRAPRELWRLFARQTGREQRRLDRMLLKILGIALAIWIALWVLGAVFEFLTWALVIGAVVFVGAAAYSAVKGRSRRSIRR
jgi:hypothetical protein